MRHTFSNVTLALCKNTKKTEYSLLLFLLTFTKNVQCRFNEFNDILWYCIFILLSWRICKWRLYTSSSPSNLSDNLQSTCMCLRIPQRSVAHFWWYFWGSTITSANSVQLDERESAIQREFKAPPTNATLTNCSLRWSKVWPLWSHRWKT